MDVHTRQGKYAASRTYPVRLPCTLGMEGAGRVIAVGHNVTTVKAGDRVAWCIAWGSYADYARIPAARCARLPDSVAYDVAAAAIFQGSTAHYLHRAAIGPVGQASGRDRLRHRQQCGKVRRRHGARRGCRLPLW
ncbi:hypothetical protein G6F57_020455 [Rhizopus arrhizus]|nr:hypothetical protein G6F57_020455 [Rhizopus arrhizus]